MNIYNPSRGGAYVLKFPFAVADLQKAIFAQRGETGSQRPEKALWHEISESPIILHLWNTGRCNSEWQALLLHTGNTMSHQQFGTIRSRPLRGCYHIPSLNPKFHTYCFTNRDADNYAFVLRMNSRFGRQLVFSASLESGFLDRIGLTSLLAKNPRLYCRNRLHFVKKSQLITCEFTHRLTSTNARSMLEIPMNRLSTCWWCFFAEPLCVRLSRLEEGCVYNKCTAATRGKLKSSYETLIDFPLLLVFYVCLQNMSSSPWIFRIVYRILTIRNIELSPSILKCRLRGCFHAFTHRRALYLKLYVGIHVRRRCSDLVSYVHDLQV